MKTKKILAVILCMAVVFSVMAAVAAVSANATTEPAPAYAVAGRTLPPPPMTPAPTTTAPPTTQAPGDGLLSWWANVLPTFTRIYNTGFDWLSRILVWGFQFLIFLVF